MKICVIGGFMKDRKALLTKRDPSVSYISLKIIGYPMYYVGNDGTVWKYWRRRGIWRQLRTNPGRDGYARVGLYHNGIEITFQVHWLVLFAFVGPRPLGLFGCHNDGNPMNNASDNLRWDTPAGNCQDKIRHGTSNRGKHYNQGEKAGKAKLCEKDVLMIRELFAAGKHTQVSLGKMYGINSSTVCGIVRGSYWQNVGGPRLSVGHGVRLNKKAKNKKEAPCV